MFKKNSLLSIDILRAIAAFGVFAYHQHIFGLIARYTSVPAIDMIDNFGAAFAVPLFFLISGYCIHLSNMKHLAGNKPLPLKEYYKRRFLRIYPPYLAALIFSVAVNYSTYNTLPTTSDFIVHLFVLQGFTVAYFNTINLVLWTVSVEIAFYLIYPIFYCIRLKYSLNKALLFTLLISTLSIVYFWSKTVLTLPQYFCVFNIWFAWCCGAFLADKETFSPVDIRKPMYILIYAGIIAFRFIPAIPNIIYFQLNILLWTGPVVFITSKEQWFVKHYSIVTKVVTSMGLSSYSLYLLHEPLITLKNYLGHRFLPTGLQFAGVTLGTLLIPVVAWYSFKYIEKPFTARKKTVAPTA
ncbi:MAG: acyltransferase [Mucilaginibacter sp.]|nr:acyltransferase [Mucilaginibacter sp.]